MLNNVFLCLSKRNLTPEPQYRQQNHQNHWDGLTYSPIHMSCPLAIAESKPRRCPCAPPESKMPSRNLLREGGARRVPEGGRGRWLPRVHTSANIKIQDLTLNPPLLLFYEHPSVALEHDKFARLTNVCTSFMTPLFGTLPAVTNPRIHLALTIFIYCPEVRLAV